MLDSPFDVTFPVNSMSGSSQCASITFEDDDIIEGDHSFTVSISNPGGAGTTAPTVATVTIDDNDGKLHIALAERGQTSDLSLISLFRHYSACIVLINIRSSEKPCV